MFVIETVSDEQWDDEDAFPRFVAKASDPDTAVYIWECLYNAWRLGFCMPHSNVNAQGMHVETLLCNIEGFEALRTWAATAHGVNLKLTQY